MQVDAKHIELHLDEEKPEGVVNEAVEQVAYADRIVLNKTELVTPADLERLEQRISAINGMATVRCVDDTGQRGLAGAAAASSVRPPSPPPSPPSTSDGTQASAAGQRAGRLCAWRGRV